MTGKTLMLGASVLALACWSAPAMAQSDDGPATQANGKAQQPSGTAQGTQAVTPNGQQNPNDIVVTGVRASLESAQRIKRNSDAVVDSIVAEDIGKLPDNTVSDALQRVTGIQVYRGGGEVSTVLIRGLPNIQSYINGREVFTGTGRGVALQDIPAEQIAGVDVYKTTLPEQIEGGIAGLIDIRYRRPFDFPGLEVAGSARTLYSDTTDKFSYIGSGMVSDRWNTSIGEIGVLIGASYNRRRYEDQTAFNFNFSPRLKPDGSGNYQVPGGGADILIPQDIGVIFNNGDRARPSGNVAIQWKPASNLVIHADGIFTGYREHFDSNYFIALSGQNNIPLEDGYTVQPGTNIAKTLTNLFNFTLTSKQAFIRKTDGYQGDIGADWTLGDNKLSAQFTYNDSTVTSQQVVLDTGFVAPRIDYDFDYNGSGTPHIAITGADPTDSSIFFVNQLFDNRNIDTSHQIAARADVEHDFDGGLLQNFKIGARFAERKGQSRGTNPSGYGIAFASVFLDRDLPGIATLAPGGDLGDRFGVDGFILSDSDYLLNNTDKIRADFGRPAGDAPFDPSRTFDLDEKVYATYAQVAYKIDGSVPIDGIFGARLINTDTGLDAIQNLNGVLQPLHRKQNYVDVLPNFSLRARVGSNVQLRLVLAKSLTRPEFAQLNPAVSLTQASATLVGSGSGGNADLQPIRSDNVDATAEWYFSRSGSLTASLFYRRLKGYIVTFASDETLPGLDGQPGVFSVSRPRNTGHGKLQGAEIAYQQFFDFLPGALGGLGAQANFTYIDGTSENPTTFVQEDLPQVSRYSYNLVAIYEKYGISARVAYNWRSKYTDGYNVSGATGLTNVLVAPLSFLDASLSYNLTDRVTLTVDGTNLLNTTYHDQFGSGGVAPRDTRQFERSFGAGVRFKL